MHIQDSNHDAANMTTSPRLSDNLTYSLRDWIDPTLIDWSFLAKNPHPMALQMLQANPDKIDWWLLSSNPSPIAIQMLLANSDKIHDGWQLYQNTNPIALQILQQKGYEDLGYYWTNIVGTDMQILRDNPHQIAWNRLAGNSSDEAVKLLLENPHQIDWPSQQCNIFANNHPLITRLFRQHIDDITGDLTRNNSDDAVQLLLEHPDKIVWGWVVFNDNPRMMQYLRDNVDKHVNWYEFGLNQHPIAMQMLQENPDKIHWWTLSQNPSIFIDNYEAPCRAYFREAIAAELMAVVWHPRNIDRFEGLGYGC